MELEKLVKLLNAIIVNERTFPSDGQLRFAFSGDLMSDALMLVKTLDEELCNDGMLLTGLATNQSIRTAEMLDIKVVLLVRGKQPTEKVINCATSAGITLILTDCSLYTASGLLYSEGIKGYEHNHG